MEICTPKALRFSSVLAAISASFINTDSVNSSSGTTLVQLLVDYLAVVDTPQRALDQIRQMTSKVGIDIEAPLATVRSHAAALIALSPKADVVFDASFSPRLDYYTGVVFEMTNEEGEVLASGGEYDRLLDRLGATERVTASGCALWTERLEREANR